MCTTSGSGDGRIVITAAKKYGARGVGIDIDEALVRKATENAAAAGVGDRVRFVSQDLFSADLSEATVVTLYLLQSLNERLRPKLVRELKPGARDRVARVQHGARVAFGKDRDGRREPSLPLVYSQAIRFLGQRNNRGGDHSAKVLEVLADNFHEAIRSDVELPCAYVGAQQVVVFEVQIRRT